MSRPDNRISYSAHCTFAHHITIGSRTDTLTRSNYERLGLPTASDDIYLYAPDWAWHLYRIVHGPQPSKRARQVCLDANLQAAYKTVFIQSIRKGTWISASDGNEVKKLVRELTDKR